MYRSGIALLIKLRHCFISKAAKSKIQETTLRNSCYYDNYKTRLSMTKYLALRNIGKALTAKNATGFNIFKVQVYLT